MGRALQILVRLLVVRHEVISVESVSLNRKAGQLPLLSANQGMEGCRCWKGVVSVMRDNKRELPLTCGDLLLIAWA